MINDKWQLHEWLSARCILDYRPNSQQILVMGYIDGQVNNIVRFDSQQEKSLFMLKYAEYIEPLYYSSKLEPNDEQYNKYDKMLWNLMTKTATPVSYKHGPIICDQ